MQNPSWFSQPDILWAPLPGSGAPRWEAWHGVETILLRENFAAELSLWILPVLFAIFTLPTMIDVASSVNSCIQLIFTWLFRLIILYFSCNSSLVLWGGKQYNFHLLCHPINIILRLEIKHIISTDVKKSMWQNSILSIRTLSKLRIEFPQPKEHYEIPKVNIILTVEDSVLSPKIKKTWLVYLLSLPLFKIRIKGSNQCNEARKIKRYIDWKKRNYFYSHITWLLMEKILGNLP